MAVPQRNVNNLRKVEDNTGEPVDIIQSSLEKHLSLSSEDTTEMLRARISEQSSLICILKQRSDDLLVKYQGLQQINSELEDRLTDCQEELDEQRSKAELLETRFMDLSDNNQAIIAFMEEYKSLNSQLKVENKQLQAENNTLFCQKLRDKELVVQNLMQEIQQLTDTCKSNEIKYRETLTGQQAKLLEQAAQHQETETSLLHQLQQAQQEQRDAVEMCKELKLKLKNAEEHSLKEASLRKNIASLTKEKEELLSLSVERGIKIQEKQEEIQQLEKKLEEEKNARTKAEERFQREANVLNADVRVKSLQSDLDESLIKYGELKKDFEAFKSHSTSLLKQERELNTKLRHMMG
ncbi:coiled-coil domain-containing protein 89 [Betta splendens]|uniref:Coiled-coil domain-containing protein 89 n=1 Tax=Betta splendens TaxID=158456 RepID=A0A6P7LGN0_BETSP|nr:coiled-coil domain-containing protein 89 [Betta splendens]